MISRNNNNVNSTLRSESSGGDDTAPSDGALRPSGSEDDLSSSDKDEVLDSLQNQIESLKIVDTPPDDVRKQNKDDDEWRKNIPESVKKLGLWIQEAENILVLTGAGISVSAGIPDFRTPGCGLYDNLQKFSLPYPEAVFELDFFRKKPQPFCSLAQEMWPGLKHVPTLTHSFIALLAEKKKLLRNYTQNIDGLEYLADTPSELLIECHGHYRTSTCISCRKPADAEKVKQSIVELGKVPLCHLCGSYVKPDIVFFGENLPDRFHSSLNGDVKKTDLVLVMGTSLQVAPVSMIPSMASRSKKALINRDLVGDFTKKGSLFVQGDCDDRIDELAKYLGWQDELKRKHERSVAKIKQN